MKILHVIWQMSVGGMERAVFQLVRELNAGGIQADLLVASRGGYYSDLLEREGFQVHELNQRHGWDFSKSRKFEKIIRDYEVVHFHNGNPILMSIAKKAGDKQLHYTQRGGDHRYSLKKKFFYWWVAKVIRNAFQISANSKVGAKKASMLYGIDEKLIEVVYNGIDFSLLEPVRSRKTVLNEIGDDGGDLIRIGTTGKLIDWKRHALLIEAVAKLNPSTYRCYIIGEGILRNNLEAAIRGHGLERNVFLLGQKKVIGDYLQLLDIFVLPSDQSESFGNSVVEAMGMGIPSVVFKDGGGIVEHISAKGGFVANDVNDLIQILNRLIESKELRTTIGQNGMEYVRSKYSTKNMIDAYSKLYRIK